MVMRFGFVFGLVMASLVFGAGVGVDVVDLPVAGAVEFVQGEDGWRPTAPIHVRGENGWRMEAEKASSLVSAGRDGGVADAAAGGGAFLGNPGGLEFVVRVKRKEVVALHVRLRRNKEYVAPGGGNEFINRSVSVQRVGLTLDGKKVLSGSALEGSWAWSWVQVSAFELTAGVHRLGVGALSGYDVDEVVLMPAEAGDFRGDELPGVKAGGLDDEDDGGLGDLGGLEDLTLDEGGKVGPDGVAVSKAALAEVSVLTTVEIAPVSVGAWGKVVVGGDLGDCTQLVEVSSDGGKHWVTVGADGSLSEVKVVGGGKDRLRVRVTRRPGASGEGGVVQEVAVSFVQGVADGVTRIVGPDLGFVFGSKGAVLHEILVNELRLGLPMRRDLFRFTWQPVVGGKGRVIAASACELSGFAKVGEGWENRWSYEELQGVCRIVPPAVRGDEWGWEMSVVNGGEGRVTAVSMPTLSGLYLDGGLKPQSLWSVRGRGIFPGTMSMGFVFAASDDEGLYLAAHDESLVGVQLGAVRENGLVSVDATSFGVVMPGKSRTYRYAVAYGSGDWHWAADKYRAWAMSWMARPEFPAWAKVSPGWWTLGSDTEAALLDRRATTLFEEARWFGLPHLQIWVGCGDGEFVGRMPYLSPRLGTPEMSKRDSELIRSMGGHIGHYIQAREWVPDFHDSEYVGYIPRRYFPDDFEVEGWDWSNRNVCNGPWTGKRGGMRIMSPMSAEWRAHIARHAGERVRLFGNDAAYFDQMGCTVMEDNNPAHGPEYHASGAGYTQMAAEALTAMRAVNPEAVIAQEGMNAATGQHVHFHLPSCLAYPDFGKFFLYTFPDTALVTGSGNNVFAQSDGDVRKYMRSRFLMHRFEVPKYDQYVRELVLMRDRVKDWQFEGRFMDDVGLSVSVGGVVQERYWSFAPTTDGVIAKWFLHDVAGEQGVLVNIQNEQEVGGELTLALDRVPFAVSGQAFVWADDLRVEPVACEVTREEAAPVLRLALPKRKISAVLIPGAVMGAAALRMSAHQPGDSVSGVVVQAVNVSAEPITARWEASVGGGLGLGVSSGEVTLGAGKVFRQVLDVEGLHRVQKMEEMVVRWSFGGHVKEARALVTPTVRNGGFELDVDANGSPDSWWNPSKVFAHIIHRYAHDVDMHELVAKVDTAVKRNGKASVRLGGTTTYELSIDGAFGPKGKEGNFGFVAGQPLYHLTPGATYEVTVYAMAKEVAGKARISLLGERVDVGLTPGVWTKVRLSVRVPETVVEARLNLSNVSAVDVWFDDVTVEKVVEL